MLNNWKIGPKLYLIIGLLAAVAAGIGSLGVDAMRTYNEKLWKSIVHPAAPSSGSALMG